MSESGRERGRCDRLLAGQSDRYVEVDLCVVVGLHRPHDFKSGLKEQKGGSVFHTHTHQSGCDGRDSRHFRKLPPAETERVQPPRLPPPPGNKHTHTHTAVKMDAAAGEESECVFQ